MIHLIRKLLFKHFVNMRWHTIVLALIFYSISSWLLLWIANEEALTQSIDFIYWLAVTGSTVGYGDLSPVTNAGKMIVAFYIIPAGLSIFALVLGRVAAWVSEQWFTGVRGMSHLDLQRHILVIGWNNQRTLQLIKLLHQERKDMNEHQDIVLCVRADIENPLPGQVEFVKVTSFNSDLDMQRACIDTAAVIIVDNPEDDLTMTSSLYASSRNPDAHILAYFNDESLAKLLKQHCPNVECMPSVAVEMLAKSAYDPGSSALHHDLLSVEEGQAQYSVALPSSVATLRVETLFQKLKQQYQATLIGLHKQGEGNILLNPDLNLTAGPGDKLFYIAESRIKDINWEQFNV